MRTVVSGFRKHKRRQRSAIYALAATWALTRRILSTPVGTLPSFRRHTGATPRPQAYLKRDVHKKNLGSPYAKESWSQRVNNLIVAYRFAIAFSLLLIVTTAWFSIVFLTPTFYLTRVTVRGQQEIAPEEIEALVRDHIGGRTAFIFPRSHRLFLGLDRLRETIASRYHLDSLVFQPDWTARGIEIEIREKPSLFLYSVDNQYFALDREGQVIREMPADTDPMKFVAPVLYEYDRQQAPAIGESVLTSQAIASVQRLAEGFALHPTVRIHSFRLRVSPQQEIVITDEAPATKDDKQKQAAAVNQELSDAAESIAQAQTIDEKVRQLKAALENLSVERLEEGKLDQLLKEQRVYSPTDGFAFQELEIYTKQGWTIKLGHDVFVDALAADELLAIFATLEQHLRLEEVREYIDLRVPNRVYYR